MELLTLSRNVLEEIIIHERPFYLASKDCFKKHNTLEKSQRAFITAIVGCSLRHKLAYDEFIKNQIGELSISDSLGLYLCFSDFLYLKKCYIDDLLLVAVNDNVTKDKVSNILEYLKDNPLIDAQYSKDSNEYLSLRYNTPLWLVKMFRKHYKERITYLLLKSLSHASMDYALNISANVLSRDFESTEIDNLYRYVGNLPFAFHPFKKEKQVVWSFPALLEMINDIDIDSLKGLAYYSEVGEAYYLSLLAKLSPSMHGDFLFSDFPSTYNAKKNKTEYGLKNANVYQIEKGQFLSILSNKVHTFILFPESSNFNLLRATPDYFLRFKQEQLDGLIANQMHILNEASDFVEDGGQIVYAVPTISFKESHGVVSNFLNNHRDFSLINEKQYMPFDNKDSVFYYAILEKTRKYED